jgi:hypothetical protein
MLSVKCVCRVVVALATAVPKGAAIVALNELTASSDPKSTYRYSNFHVQFDGRNPSFPSIPAPAEKPTLVLAALKALPLNAKGAGQEVELQKKESPLKADAPEV